MLLAMAPIEFFLHLDEHLAQAVGTYGPWIYGILTGLVFCETGLVIMPFLPGDTLLFAAGLLSHPDRGSLNAPLLAILLTGASILGDSTNFWIGHFFGKAVFKDDAKFFKKQHLVKTRAYYDKHGAKTVIMGKFVPFVRTLAPFVAGMDAMPYQKFLTVSITGSVLWVGICLGAGYFLGGVPFVKENFGEIVLGICLLSVVAIAMEGIRSRKHKQVIE